MSLTNRLDQQHAELAVIKASEVEFTDGPDAALQVLGPPADPIRMRAVLGILIRAGRHQQAADLISEQHPHEKWVDIGAFAFAFLGETDRARKTIDRADECSDPFVIRKTRFGFAGGIIERWHVRYGDESLLAVKDWPTSDLDLARSVIDVLDPLLSIVRTNRRIQGELQLGAVTYAVYCSHILKDQQQFSLYAGWLVKHIPVPLMVAELCLRRLIDCPVNLASRLSGENPGEFQAAYLAALVDRELLNHAEEAFDALVRLASKATTDDEKKSVCIGLFETSGKCSPEKIDLAIQVVKELRPNDSRLFGLLQTFQKIAAGDLGDARRHLDVLRDESDGVWWQVHAQLCEKTGDEDGAQTGWEKASELLPHPAVVRRSVQASLDRRRFESAVRGLKKLLINSPNSAHDLKALAWTLVKLSDYAQASEYLQLLVTIDPLNTEYRLGLAQCLARSARTSDAIIVLEPVCKGKEQPTEAILLQSELLRAHGRTDDAIKLLETIAGDHWDEPGCTQRTGG